MKRPLFRQVFPWVLGLALVASGAAPAWDGCAGVPCEGEVEAVQCRVVDSGGFLGLGEGEECGCPEPGALPCDLHGPGLLPSVLRGPSPRTKVQALYPPRPGGSLAAALAAPPGGRAIPGGEGALARPGGASLYLRHGCLLC